jgi:hypothetical protein
MARLEVELLVCPEKDCHQAGKLPNSAESLRGYCVGSLQNGTAHRKARMVSVTFKGKAPEPVETEAKV